MYVILRYWVLRYLVKVSVKGIVTTSRAVKDFLLSYLKDGLSIELFIVSLLRI